MQGQKPPGTAGILFTVWPLAGHVFPNLAIAEQLHRRGYRTGFYTGASMRSAVESRGAVLFPFSRIDEAKVTKSVLSENGILGTQHRRLQLKKMYREWVLETAADQIADVEEVL